MKKLVKTLLVPVLLLISNMTMAQSAEMADGLRSEGKIYVIVLIIIIVLSGMITYLFLLDRKLNKIEKRLKEKNGLSR